MQQAVAERDEEAPARAGRGEGREEQREEKGGWFWGSSCSTMSSFHQAGIPLVTERDASAVPGKVTSACPGSSRDTMRLRCAREANSAPLPSAATRPLLLLPKTSSTLGGMQQPPPGHIPSPEYHLQRGTQGCCSRSAPSLLETCP